MDNRARGIGLETRVYGIQCGFRSFRSSLYGGREGLAAAEAACGRALAAAAARGREAAAAPWPPRPSEAAPHAAPGGRGGQGAATRGLTRPHALGLRGLFSRIMMIILFSSSHHLCF